MKKVLKILFIIILVILLLIGLFIGKLILDTKKALRDGGYIEDWSDSDGTVYSDQAYGDGSASHLYDLYIPADADPAKSQAVMLFIHGGSWTSGTRKDMDYAAKRYAKAGYITASMEYSLFQSDYTGTTIPAILDEITACLEAIKARGADLGFTIDQAALSGGSAGGHLALLYSYSRADQSPIPLKFVFEQTGPTDFHGDTWGVESEFVAGFVSAFSGKTITAEQVERGEAEDVINLVSPAAWVNENTIPSLIAYGGKDSIVGTKQHLALIPKLEQYHIPYTYIAFPNSDHPLASDPDSRDAWHEAVLEYAKTYFGY